MVPQKVSVVISVIALLLVGGGITYTSVRLGDTDSASSNLVGKVNSISNDVASLKSQIGQLGQQQADRLKAVEAELAERKAKEALVEAARKEGKVVFYAAMTIEEIEELKKRFEATFPGVTLEFVRILGGPLTERLQTEFSTGRRAGDVVQAPADQIPYFKDKGWLEKYASPEYASIPNIYRDPENLFAGYFVNPVVVAYNTKLVSQADIPKSYDDIVHPKWKGKFSIGDPFVHTSTLAWFDVMKKVMADKWKEWVSKMRDLRPNLQVSLTPVAKIVVVGEASIGVTLTGSLGPELTQGNPIAVAPVKPLAALLVSTGILKSPPHPNAAKLFVDWLYSEDAVRLLAEKYGRVTARGLASSFFKDLVPDVKYTLGFLSDHEGDRLKQEMGLPWI